MQADTSRCTPFGNDRTDDCYTLYEERLSAGVFQHTLDSKIAGYCGAGPACYSAKPPNMLGNANLVCDPQGDLLNAGEIEKISRFHGKISNPSRVFAAPPSFDKISSNGGRDPRPQLQMEYGLYKNKGIASEDILTMSVGTPATQGVMNTVRNPLNYIYDYSAVMGNDRENNRQEVGARWR